MAARVQEVLISIWGGIFTHVKRPQFSLSQPPAPLATLFSARNLALLQSSSKLNATWDTFEAFVGRLLMGGLLLPIGLEDQCLSLVAKEWPDDLLRRLGSCITGVIDSWKKNQKSTNYQDLDQDFVTEFIGWICAYNDIDDNLENFPELPSF